MNRSVEQAIRCRGRILGHELRRWRQIGDWHVGQQHHGPHVGRADSGTQTRPDRDACLEPIEKPIPSFEEQFGVQVPRRRLGKNEGQRALGSQLEPALLVHQVPEPSAEIERDALVHDSLVALVRAELGADQAGPEHTPDQAASR